MSTEQKSIQAPEAVVISSKGTWFAFHPVELWRFRALIYLLVRRDFIAKYKQTVIGPVWVLFNPIINAVVFTLVFGLVVKVPTDGIPSFLFYLSGQIFWSLFAGSFGPISNTLVANSALFSKVYFPRLSIPIASVLFTFTSFLIHFSIFVAFSIYYREAIQLSPSTLLLPLYGLQMLTLGFGAGLIVAAMMTRYRDLENVMAFATSVLMYASPIVYPSSQIPERFRPLYEINPIANILGGIRHSIFGVGHFDLTTFALSWALTIAIALLGIVLFSKAEGTFVDTV